MPDDHSEVVPLLPIPNRTVKRFCADDSADSRVKVGHRQAIQQETPSPSTGRFSLSSKVSFKKNAKRVLEYKASLITANNSTEMMKVKR